MVQYRELYNNIERVVLILKPCTIYCIKSKNLDIYCAKWKILHHLHTNNLQYHLNTIQFIAQTRLLCNIIERLWATSILLAQYY